VKVMCTLLSTRQPGRPLSRAKAQQMRDVEAEKPTFALIVSSMTILAITAAPARDCTAWWKTAMKGKAGFSASTASTSPRRKRTVRIMAKPREPLMAIPVMMERGTTICAFWISSDNWVLSVSVHI
jgi:hypothetical protein